MIEFLRLFRTNTTDTTDTAARRLTFQNMTHEQLVEKVLALEIKCEQLKETVENLKGDFW